jgi:hypothetical protein
VAELGICECIEGKTKTRSSHTEKREEEKASNKQDVNILRMRVRLGVSTQDIRDW